MPMRRHLLNRTQPGSPISARIAPLGRRRAQILALSLIGCLASLALTCSALAVPPQDPKITDLGDAFLVDSPDPGSPEAQDPPWFCRQENTNPDRTSPRTKCTEPSWTAARSLIFAWATELTNTQPNAQNLMFAQRGDDSVPGFLRVSKARNNCVAEHPDACATGVPPPPVDCPSYASYNANTNPSCALQWLAKNFQIRLGVVISASTGDSENEDGGSGATDPSRSVRNISYQACQIARDDDRGFFSFVFLDFARYLTLAQRRNVVDLIQGGEVKGDGGAPDHDCDANPNGYRVMTNDQNYAPAQAGELDTNAWAHAKDVEILRQPNLNANIADGDPLEVNDRQFSRDVRDRDSQPVLRFEVTAQTGQLAALSLANQCALIGTLSQYQGRAAPYALIHPLFVHGSIGGDNHASPYDSLASSTQWPAGKPTNTFGLQSKLFRLYPQTIGSPPSACP